jgi:hypothetical protein
VFVLQANHLDRKFIGGSQRATDSFLVRGQAIIQASQRVAAGEFQCAGEFLIEDGQELRGKLFVILFRTAPAARRRLEIFDRQAVMLFLLRFDKQQQGSSRNSAPT